MLIRVNIMLLVTRLSLESSEFSGSSVASESGNSESNELLNDFSVKKASPKKLAKDDTYERIDEETHRIKVRPPPLKQNKFNSEKETRMSKRTKTVSSDEENGYIATQQPSTFTAEEYYEEEDSFTKTLKAEKHRKTKESRHLHHNPNSMKIVETRTMFNEPSLNEAPMPKDCKDVYTAQSLVEKGYAQMSRPFAVSIHKKGAFYATGALLDHRWILTSAAEFYNVRESTRLFKARLGSFDSKRGGTLSPIRSIFVHPQFVQGLPSYDVALLKIASPVKYTCTIMPTPLTNTRAGVVKARFMVTYWPKLIVKGQALPVNARERFKHQHMRVTLQNLMAWDECFKRLQAVGVALSESSLCLRPIYSHHSPCMTDSGAPVLAPDKLWGVTSGWVSPNCSQSQSPTIITRVSSPDVRVWLDSHVALRWMND